jgi:hypothetical protein
MDSSSKISQVEKLPKINLKTAVTQTKKFNPVVKKESSPFLKKIIRESKNIKRNKMINMGNLIVRTCGDDDLIFNNNTNKFTRNQNSILKTFESIKNISSINYQNTNSSEIVCLTDNYPYSNAFYNNSNSNLYSNNVSNFNNSNKISRISYSDSQYKEFKFNQILIHNIKFEHLQKKYDQVKDNEIIKKFGIHYLDSKKEINFNKFITSSDNLEINHNPRANYNFNKFNPSKLLEVEGSSISRDSYKKKISNVHERINFIKHIRVKNKNYLVTQLKLQDNELDKIKKVF